MNFGDYHQQRQVQVQVRLYRPSTGSSLTINVAQGTDPETILQQYPGWEFEAS